MISYLGYFLGEEIDRALLFEIVVERGPIQMFIVQICQLFELFLYLCHVELNLFDFHGPLKKHQLFKCVFENLAEIFGKIRTIRAVHSRQFERYLAPGRQQAPRGRQRTSNQIN
jgi:hypothetical protein